MSDEPRVTDAIPPGAKYVASSVSEVYYATDDAAWTRFDPAERRWFQTEKAARIAGYRPALPGLPGLEEFELIERLGHGGTSTVYRARDLSLGRDVAIKVMHRSDCADEESLARFAREARLVARLHHPGVVSVYAVKQLPPGGLALVMEYIPGRTLSELLADGPLPLEQAESILRDVGEALAAAHAQGIVHRDVKPQNIFLHQTTGRALLADFGIAIPLNETNRLTHTGAVIGTPAYMAPEQFEGADPDARSDLYSLGLVGWEMLTGVSPWAGETLYGIIRKQKEVELPPLKKLRPGLPSRVRAAIEGALRKDPQARWRDVRSFLSHVAGETGRFGWLNTTVERILGRLSGSAAPAAAPAPAAAAALAKGGEIADAHTMQFVPGAGAAPPVTAGMWEGRRAGWRPRGAAVLVVAAAMIAAIGVALHLQREASAEPDRAERAITGEGAGSTATPAQKTAPPEIVSAYSWPVPSDSTIEVVFDDSPLEPDTAQPAPPELAAANRQSAAATEAPPSELAAANPQPAAAAEAPAPVDAEVPAPETPPVARLAVDRTRWRITAGGMHSCAIGPDERLYCWGGDERGQVGTDAGPRSSLPTPLAIEHAVRSVVAGGFHSCALDASGFAYCWGDNREGQLGGGSAGASSGFTRVLDRQFHSLTIGFAHSCGIGADGVAYCWGSDAHGQLGNGGAVPRPRPTRVLTDTRFVQLAAGWNHTCALVQEGRAHCWGDNSAGQLGDGTHVSKSLPAAVPGSASFRHLTAGGAHTCGLTTEGEAYCWGQNADGRLGDGNTADRFVPTRVRTPLRFLQISAGGRHTCAVTADGNAYCWGQNNYGQLGDGSTTPRSAPIRVRSERRFTAIVAGGSHTCATSSSGAQLCWGYNIEGQVGDGTLAHRVVPQRVETEPAL